MRKFVSLFALLLFCGIISAQDHLQNNRKPRRLESPESMARREASKMKREMNLKNKQYDKLYSLFLKENQALIKSRQNGNMPSPPRDGRVGGGRPGGGFRPDNGTGGDRGFDSPSGMGGPRPEGFDGNVKQKKDSGMTPEQMDKRRLKKEKKIEKIVGKQAYAKWKISHPNTDYKMLPKTEDDDKIDNLQQRDIM